MNSQTDIIFQEAKKVAANPIKNGYEFIGVHEYTSHNGSSTYWRIRLKKGNKKLMLPMHKNDQGVFIGKEPVFSGGKKPIYRLFDLISNPSETVYLVEGESCADKLIEMGLLASTSGGSTSAKSADWTPLKGRAVIIWRDANDVGLTYAEQVTEILIAIGCSVKWVDIDDFNLPDGGDCVDWLSVHPDATKETILQLSVVDPSTAEHEHIQGSGYPRYELKDDGVYYCRDAKDSIWICSWLTIKALTRDAQGVNWGCVLEFRDEDNALRRWIMPKEFLGGSGEELVRELLRLGLCLASGAFIKKLLIEYVTEFKTVDRARSVMSTGWQKDCFVLPNKVYGKSAETVILQSDAHIAMDYSQSGTLSDWQNNIATKCLGNSRLIFAVSLAFAAPLLRIARAENGGFHLRGESSTGKSTALAVAASVWGGRNHVQNWRATDNGLEGLATQHNDILLVLDELSQIDPRFAGEVAYMLANGQGKVRAGRSGAARQRYIWRLLFLSSGETSLASHMMEAGKRAKAGQEIRMVDIPADCGCGMGIFEKVHDFVSPSAFADYLKVSSGKYHGVAGDSFLENLVYQEELSFHTKIQNLQIDFMRQFPDATHGQVRRVAQRFALVGVAGKIATDFGITGWTDGISIAAASKCFKAWKESRDGSSVSYEQDETLKQVRHFFQENAARFDVVKPHRNGPTKPQLNRPT